MPSAPDSDIALIARAVLRLSRRLRVETSRGALHGAALGLVATLHRLGPMPAVALAEEEGLAPQSLTRLLTQLEAAAMIARAVDPADRRNKIITLTPHGRHCLGEAMRTRRAWLAAALTERLDDAEREALLSAAPLMLRLAE